jgi:site-specific DNA-cytosine methylase
MALQLTEIEYTHAHLFGGVGGGAMGFNRASARLGNLVGRLRCLGSIDVDAAACRAFEQNVGVPATAMDLFDHEQYVAWHGRQPPPGWREAGPADLHRAFGFERPDLGFLSAPCKGLSGLLPESSARLPKYEALNRLTLRGVWLWLEAFQDDPTPLLFFENVPRIMVRGRHLLDRIAALFRAYGYAWAETTHDCGELGGLGQSRKRFLGVARHLEKVPPFLYQPPKRRLRGVGEILDLLPLPGDIARGGPMHRVPALHWKTWVRLAFVEAGKDWRSLNQLRVEDGYLSDFAIAPDTGWQGGVMGVHPWASATGVVTGRSAPTTGAHSVADPRGALWGAGQADVTAWSGAGCAVTTARSPLQNRGAVADPRVDGHPRSVQLGVRRWTTPAAVVKGDVSVGTGPYAVADLRFGEGRTPFSNVFRIVARDEAAPAVTSAKGALAAVADPSGGANRHVNGKYRITPYDRLPNAVIAVSTTGHGASAVADVRTGFGPNSHRNKLRVVGYGERSPTVTGSDRVGSGALSVADIRPTCLNREDREGYATQGHYGVVAWDDAAGAIPASAKNNNGSWSVADGRLDLLLPALDQQLVCVIIARDGTWHRPFTTLDLAALQSLVDPADPLCFHLEGSSDSAFREWIGNAVPPGAAQAMGEVALHTLLLAEQGESFRLSDTPIWVRQLAVALSVDTSRQVAL